MAGKGGGAWKVAYADFVTAMMAFFLVMWITGQSEPVKHAIAQYFENPLGPFEGAKPAAEAGKPGSTTLGPERSGRGPGRGPGKVDLEQTLKPDAKDVAENPPPKVTLRDNPDHTRTGTVVLFAEHSAELDKTAQERLAALVPLLIGKANKVEIRGHCSRRPLPEGSTAQDAWQLSYLRCLATMEFLVSRGIEPQRIRLSQAGIFEPYHRKKHSPYDAEDSRVEVYALSEYVQSFSDTRDSEHEFPEGPAN